MSHITITEVGARDGLQNEKTPVPTDAKAAFIRALAKSGVAEVEITAFVSPKWVPQLADAEQLCPLVLPAPPGVIYSALVPNEKGLERAIACGVEKIAVFTAATDSFNTKNTNSTVAESIERLKPVVAQAKGAKREVRGYVSVAFHCPFDGPVAPTQVIPVVQALFDMGCDEVSIGDTIGKAVPREVRALLPLAIAASPRGADGIVMHFHDTYGTAVANALVSWQEFGITRFDSSAGGLGGCPYAPGATGNVATEDLVFALRASGAEVPVDIAVLARAAQAKVPHLGHGLTGRVQRTVAS
jgi:hydroxymethylglutaryl-CoA lyase